MIDADRGAVLVVEDNPSDAALLARQLQDRGYVVHTARNGLEGLQVVLAEGIPIIIADWLLPEMDGLELCRTLHAHEGIRFAYVIMLTARSDEASVVTAFQAGADDFLTKPWNAKELIARVSAGQRTIRLQQDLDRRNRQVHQANAEMAVAYRKLADANEQLHRMATTDALTGLTNRRESMNRIDQFWAMSERYDEPLSFIILDIDHFKRCNDTYGHSAGDRVLQDIADALRETARISDAVCRIGGEEFLILCPKTDEAAAAACAERLRRAVEEKTIRVDGRELHVTVSAGVAQRRKKMDSPDRLLKDADDALYRAKRNGRNRVVRFNDAPCVPSLAHDGDLPLDPSTGS